MNKFTAALVAFSVQAVALRLHQENIEEELGVEIDTQPLKDFNPTYIEAVEAREAAPASTVWSIAGPHGSTFTCTETEEAALACSIDVASLELEGFTEAHTSSANLTKKTLVASKETVDEHDGMSFGWKMQMTCNYHSDAEGDFYKSDCDFAVYNTVSCGAEAESCENSEDVYHQLFVDGCGEGRDACLDADNIVYEKVLYGPEGIELDCQADGTGKVECYSELYGDVGGYMQEYPAEGTSEGYVMVILKHAVEEIMHNVDCKFTSEEHSECRWGRSWADSTGNWQQESMVCVDNVCPDAVEEEFEDEEYDEEFDEELVADPVAEVVPGMDCSCHNEGRSGSDMYVPDERNSPPNDCWILDIGYDKPFCPEPVAEPAEAPVNAAGEAVVEAPVNAAGEAAKQAFVDAAGEAAVEAPVNAAGETAIEAFVNAAGEAAVNAAGE